MTTVPYLSLSFLFLSHTTSGWAANCAKDQYLVQSHARRAYVKSDGTHVRATTVKSHCKLRSSSYEFWIERFSAERPPDWPHKKEQFLDWKTEDREKVLEALEDLPEELRMKSIQGLHRSTKSTFEGNSASQIMGRIVLYNEAFNSTKNLARVIAHEIAHEYYDQLNGEVRQDYRRAAEWTLETDLKARSYYWRGRDKGYVADDGRNSQTEDFANNIEFFLFDPAKLKKETPKVYQWIMGHFGDKFKVRGVTQ